MPGEQAVEIEVADDEVDLASGLLWAAGVTAVAEHPRGVGRVGLRADRPAGGIAAVEDALDGRWPVRVVEVADAGLDGWRDHAEVVRVGRRLVVRPPWKPLGPVADDAVVVEVDPGATFGHGAHPTTRLCLAALEDLRDGCLGAGAGPGGGSTVLDVGCGSGVLAVAAALLGAERVVAVDVDPAAIVATRANCERNGVGSAVTAHLVGDEDHPDPLVAVDGTFAVVVANIGAAALVALAPHLVARVRPGGALVLSGLLDPPPPALADAFAGTGVRELRSQDGWTALIATGTRA